MIRVTFDLLHDAVVAVSLVVTVPTEDAKTAQDEAERYLNYLLSGKAKRTVSLARYPRLEEVKEGG